MVIFHGGLGVSYLYGASTSSCGPLRRLDDHRWFIDHIHHHPLPIYSWFVHVQADSSIDSLILHVSHMFLWFTADLQLIRHVFFHTATTVRRLSVRQEFATFVTSYLGGEQAAGLSGEDARHWADLTRDLPYPWRIHGAANMVTFTINIPPMLVYITYMDPMGMVNVHLWFINRDHHGSSNIFLGLWL